MTQMFHSVPVIFFIECLCRDLLGHGDCRSRRVVVYVAMKKVDTNFDIAMDLVVYMIWKMFRGCYMLRYVEICQYRQMVVVCFAFVCYSKGTEWN